MTPEMKIGLRNLCKSKNVEYAKEYSMDEDHAYKSKAAGDIDGWCLGMVCEWLSYQFMVKKSFWTDWDKGLQHDRVSTIMSQQRAAHERKEPDFDTVDEKSLAKGAGMKLINSYGLQKKNNKVLNGGEFVKVFSNCLGLFNVVRISGTATIDGPTPKGFTHALGTSENPADLRFFDPNYGEFSFPSKPIFADWIKGFLDLTYRTPIAVDALDVKSFN